jgi:hypothetical protein
MFELSLAISGGNATTWIRACFDDVASTTEAITARTADPNSNIANRNDAGISGPSEMD